MSCNCKANEQILKIQRNFGSKVSPPISEKLKFLIEEGLKTLVLMLMLIPVTPILFIGVILMNLMGFRHINLNKIVNLIRKQKGNE